MLLAEALYKGDRSCADAWNFGPDAEGAKTVELVAQRLAQLWGDGARYEVAQGSSYHESCLLRLDSGKARQKLKWLPLLDFGEAVFMAVDWYQKVHKGGSPLQITESHIRQYMERVIYRA
jgi:CDP-glucose 4,6-dehydratase